MLRPAILIASAVLFTSPAVALSQSLLDGPETIVFDSINDRYLVSNMSTWNIVEIDRNGSYSVFSTEVYRPYGMTIVGNTLYVGGDDGSRGGVIGLDLTTGERVFEVLSSSWYFSVNGLTADTSGNVYFACTGLNRIYRVSISDETATSVAIIPIPNAVYFDARNFRLLVTTNNWGTQLYTVDLTDNSVSTIPIMYGQFSGLAEDGLHNVYLAYFSQGSVYRYDSLFTSPPELIATGQNGPEGICFDRLHSLLCVPNLMADAVSFHPMEIDVWPDADTVAGWEPFEVNFSGASTQEISEWHWYFGDGESSSGQSPIHIYEIAGYFDVTLDAVTAAGDTIKRVFRNSISCLADTMWVPDIEMAPDSARAGANIGVTVFARNTVPISRIEIPIEYAGDLDLVYDSLSTAGCRTESFSSIQETGIDAVNKRITLILRTRIGSPLYLDRGTGPVARAYFHTVGAPGQHSEISIAGYDPGYDPLFEARSLEYSPVTHNGTVGFTYYCGDADGSGGIDIDDAVFLVAYIFTGGPAPEPLPAGDADCTGGVDIDDVVYLIAYIFAGGNEPCDSGGDGEPDC